MTAPAGRAFRVGDVLGVSFSIFFRNLVPFCSLAVLVFSPLVVVDFLVLDTSSAQAMVAQVFSAAMIALIVLGFLLNYVVNAALVYGAIQDLRGQRATIGECIGKGIAVALPTLVVALLTGILVVVGTMLLIVPGIIILVMLWVAIPVSVVERPGVFQSLGRSRRLTKGSRWRLFGVILVVAVIWYGLSWVVTLFVNPLQNPLAYSLLSLAFHAVTAPIWAVTSAVSYYALRMAKEGVEIEQIAAVFD